MPLPWAGQASTVFSLTALFGAYLAIFEVLGLAAILGVVLGSVAGLFLIRHACIEANQPSFELLLLSRRFAHRKIHNTLLWWLLAAIQIGFATSELVIMREVAIRGFGMLPKHATVFVFAVALIGYFYCLVGGWAAVFRTDIVQLLLMVAMFVAIGGILLFHQYATGAPIHFTNYSARLSGTGPLRLAFSDLQKLPLVRSALNAFVGFGMGFGLLACSPDTWKRVYVSTFHAQQRRFLFQKLLFSGILPFLLLLPVAMIPSRPTASSIPDPIATIFSAQGGQIILGITLLGMISCFLSAFDSALITAAQIILVRPYRSTHAEGNSLSNYQFILGCIFLCIFLFTMVAITGIPNPYFLALVLLGPYAVLAGLIIGTRGLTRPFEGGEFPWAATLAISLWIIYVVNIPNAITTPSYEQVFAAPIGVILFVLFLLSTMIASHTSHKRTGQSNGNDH